MLPARFFRPFLKRRSAKDELRASEERYRNLVEASHELIWAVDDAGLITYMNQASRRIYGREPEEMIGRPFLDFVPLELHATLATNLAEAMSTGKVLTDYRSTMHHADGSLVTLRSNMRLLLDDSGRTIGITGTSQNVTVEEQTAEALRRTLERLEHVGRATNDVVWDWDLVRNTLWWNDNFSQLFGYHWDKAETGLESWTDHIHPDDLPRVKEGITAVIDGTGSYWDAEYRFLKSDGTAADIFDRGYVIRDSGGRPVRMIGAMMDMTERKRAEESVRQAEHQLRQSQKLEAVGHLSGGVAHDFNNILTVIQGNASLLGVEPDAAERADYVEQILRAVQRGVSLTRQLLSFSRKQAMQRSQVDLGDIAAHISKMLSRTLPENIIVRSEYEAELPSVDADAAMIEQILLNLAVNARDAMPSGGTLTLGTRRCTIEARRAAGVIGASAGSRVCLFVRDTGVGIPSESLPHIFEPFFTTKEAGKGTGLGLSTVYGIVHQHGGWIEVTTRPDEGTTFDLYFPASPGAACAEIPDAAVLAADIPAGSENILVVEDEPQVRALARKFLEQSGYTVVEAASGAEALEVWRPESAIRLLLTDLIMPGGMNGRELAERLCALDPQLKVIYSSGYSADIFGDRSGDARIPLLQKPYGAPDLLHLVRRTLDGDQNGRCGV